MNLIKLIGKWLLAIAVFSCISITVHAADVPLKLNYQGTLTDGSGQPTTGQKSITFKLYTVLSGGTAFWTETQTVPLDTSGRFSVTLGSVTALNKDLFSGTTFIGIKVGTDPELAPRQQLTSVAYALKAADTVPAGVITMWSGSLANIPAGWALCDGNNGTPNLRDKFIVGAGSGYAVGATGGEASHVLTVNEMPSHNHDGITGGQNSNHTHTGTLTSVNRDGSSGTRVREADPSGTNGGVSYTTDYASNDHAHGIALQGGGAGHENRPPYYALAYIMKL